MIAYKDPSMNINVKIIFRDVESWRRHIIGTGRARTKILVKILMTAYAIVDAVKLMQRACTCGSQKPLIGTQFQIDFVKKAAHQDTEKTPTILTAV